MAKTKTVYIPARTNHDGVAGIRVKLNWICPQCGGPRGIVAHGCRSYDGSRILYCDSWENPCNHVDKYEDVRQEARDNGMNDTHYAHDYGVIDFLGIPKTTRARCGKRVRRERVDNRNPSCKKCIQVRAEEVALAKELACE